MELLSLGGRTTAITDGDLQNFAPGCRNFKGNFRIESKSVFDRSKREKFLAVHELITRGHIRECQATTARQVGKKRNW